MKTVNSTQLIINETRYNIGKYNDENKMNSAQ